MYSCSSRSISANKSNNGKKRKDMSNIDTLDIDASNGALIQMKLISKLHKMKSLIPYHILAVYFYEEFNKLVCKPTQTTTIMRTDIMALTSILKIDDISDRSNNFDISIYDKVISNITNSNPYLWASVAVIIDNIPF